MIGVCDRPSVNRQFSLAFSLGPRFGENIERLTERSYSPTQPSSTQQWRKLSTISRSRHIPIRACPRRHTSRPRDGRNILCIQTFLALRLNSSRSSRTETSIRSRQSRGLSHPVERITRRRIDLKLLSVVGPTEGCSAGRRRFRVGRWTRTGQSHGIGDDLLDRCV